MKFIPDRLQAILISTHSTVEECAKACNVSPETVRCWLGESTMPKLKNILALQEHFDVPLTYFFTPYKHRGYAYRTTTKEKKEARLPEPKEVELITTRKPRSAAFRKKMSRIMKASHRKRKASM
jgi:transcriptional regulator with XRE-family HTH domain